MDVLIIGCGSIGVSLANAMERIPEVGVVYITDQSHVCSKRVSEKLEKLRYAESVSDVLDQVDFVVEAASQEAVGLYAPDVLARGKDLLIMSIGALADEKLFAKIENLARMNGARIIIPSGAICGIDGILAAGAANIESVKVTTIKPPASIGASEYISQQGIDLDALKEPTTIFAGRARDAVKHFPKNVNIAATVSLAGIGFDRTQVDLIVDPAAERIRHVIEVRGDFGSFKVEVENLPSPRNPKTSYLAVLSAIAAVKMETQSVWVIL